MEAHISGSTNNVERRFVKIQNKDTGSGDTHFGEVNGAIIVLHHLLQQIFRVFFFWFHYAVFPFGSNKATFSI